GKLFTNVAMFEAVDSQRNSFIFRYRSTRPESRLLCLSRQVPWSLGPTMWGNPPAQLRETACLAHGDEYCEYQLRWFDSSRLLPVGLGLLAGIALAALAAMLGWHGLALGAFPVAGIAVGYALELRRASRINVAYAQELNTVLRDLGQAEAETRAEI